MITNRRTLVWRAESPASRSRYASSQTRRAGYPYRREYRDRDYGYRGRSRPRPYERRRRPTSRRQAPARRNLTPEEIAQAKAEGYGRQYIQKQIRNKTPMVFATYEGELRGTILHRLRYNLILRLGRERRIIDKLDIKYCYKQKVEEKILPLIQIDEGIRAQNLGPVVDRDRRFHVENRVLLDCYRNRYPVTVTLRGGEMISGIVDWYSQYEIKLEVKKRVGVLVFRHALYNFEVQPPGV